ncbi:MAG TPA: hypothetical protein VFV38_08450 [Ktedonobacteraceae bacterium]|nr:hypothetical protein [Ktedonobacteraceae bacterium]
MLEIFLLCHEGEVPYVVRSLQDALQDDATMQIVSQGSTEKMHMGYVLLVSSKEIPPACLAELQANPDIYLYAIHDPEAADSQDEAEDEAEGEPARSAHMPLPLQL